MKNISVIFLILLVAGCAARGPERIGEERPRVSYSYEDGEAEMAKQDAAKYCFDTYGRSARVIGDVRNGDERIMTFECVVAPQ